MDIREILCEIDNEAKRISDDALPINHSYFGEKKREISIPQNDICVVRNDELMSKDGEEFISIVYEKLLHREAKEGLQHFMPLLAGGKMSKADIIADVGLSEEGIKNDVFVEGNRPDSINAKALIRLDNEQFLRQTYRWILGREPDEYGFNAHLNNLISGKNKILVLYDIRNSPEGKKRGIRLYGCNKLYRKKKIRWIIKHMPVIGPVITRAHFELVDRKRIESDEINELLLRVKDLEKEIEKIDSITQINKAGNERTGEELKELQFRLDKMVAINERIIDAVQTRAEDISLYISSQNEVLSKKIEGYEAVSNSFFERLNISTESLITAFDKANNSSKSITEQVENTEKRITEQVDNTQKKLVDIHEKVEEVKNIANTNLAESRDRENASLMIDNSIFSWIINQSLTSNFDLAKTEVYNYYKSIHELLAVHKRTDGKPLSMHRCGRGNDGGYMMVFPISESKIAYSFGIADDVTWDIDMAKQGYDVYQYDHTIENLPYDNDKFHWSKIGITGLEETDELKTMKTLLQQNGHLEQNGLCLKMDIEEYEWDFLNQCSEDILDQFDQIIIELHYLNDFRRPEKVISALEKLTKNHAAIYVHGNNYQWASFCGDLITPNVLEVTLINRKRYDLSACDISNISFDSIPNRINTQEIYWTKW